MPYQFIREKENLIGHSRNFCMTHFSEGVLVLQHFSEGYDLYITRSFLFLISE